MTGSETWTLGKGATPSGGSQQLLQMNIRIDPE